MEDLSNEEKYLHEGLEWQWIAFVSGADWDDSKLISATYSSIAWSPYMIPHAVNLSHYYHSKTGWSSVDFFC